MANFEHALTPATKKMWAERECDIVENDIVCNVIPLLPIDIKKAQKRLDVFRNKKK